MQAQPTESAEQQAAKACMFIHEQAGLANRCSLASNGG